MLILALSTLKGSVHKSDIFSNFYSIMQVTLLIILKKILIDTKNEKGPLQILSIYNSYMTYKYLQGNVSFIIHSDYCWIVRWGWPQDQPYNKWKSLI